MSVRDEIARALTAQVYGAVELSEPELDAWRKYADALMPIVERVAREAAIATMDKIAHNAYHPYGRKTETRAEFVAEIVRRVMEGGQ